MRVGLINVNRNELVTDQFKRRMTMTTYERTNKTTGAVMTGNWFDVCDFDKRIWTDPVKTVTETITQTGINYQLHSVDADERKPLAMVWAVRTRNHQVHIERVPIFTLHDLRELRI